MIRDALPLPVQDANEVQRTNELVERVDRFLNEELDADEVDHVERIPQDVIDGLGQLGVLGMTVPKEYGGGGFSHTSYCRVLERISAHCASTAVLVGAHQSIGLKAFGLNGNAQQKAPFLPPVAAVAK